MNPIADRYRPATASPSLQEQEPTSNPCAHVSGRGSAVLDNWGRPEPLPLDIEQLHRRCMGRIELVDRLLASFEKRFPLELMEIEEALNPLDEPRLLQLVHRLKGAAANISAPLLHGVIEQMESAIRAGQQGAAEHFVSRLQHEWERFTEYKGAVCSP